jgi:hypothetical protein
MSLKKQLTQRRKAAKKNRLCGFAPLRENSSFK